LALLPVTLTPWFLGFAGMTYLVAASVLGLIFLAGAVAVYRETGDRAARGLFGYSIVYLFLLFGLLVLDRTPGYLP
jgi:protoheme IX farnesyltransferase